jgi:UTP--glucose-1-phosphate uridylyltransferase
VQLPASLADYPFDSETFDDLRGRVHTGALDPAANRLPAPPQPLSTPPLDLRPAAAATAEAEAELDELRARGRAALADGHIAILVLNGGMATRFGGGAKGIVPVVEARPQASFLAVKLGQVRAAAQALDASIPVVLMHSFATRGPSEAHLADIDWAGVTPGDRDSFSQSVMPRVLPDGTPLAELPEAAGLDDTDLFSAPGHGDTLGRLRGSGALARLRERGVGHVLVSNVDNLGASLDPLLVGAHLQAAHAGAGITVEAVRRADGDAGGCIARLASGRPAIVEGFRLPQGTDLADYPHFNTNTLWLSLDAVDRELDLSWFAVRKRIAWPDAGRADADGMLDVVQFETLIGQATERVDSAFVEVDRATRFVPIKTRDDLATERPLLERFAREAGRL